MPQIEVTFDIDANGIVNVSKDRGTGTEQKITISGGSALPKEEIERMVKEAEAHAEEDRKRREETEARNTAEQPVYSTAEKFLTDNADKLPADGRGAVDTALDDLKQSSRSPARPPRTSRPRRRSCPRSPRRLGTAMYAAASESGAAGGAGSGAGAQGAHTGSGSDEDVVDAEVVDDDAEDTK